LKIRRQPATSNGNIEIPISRNMRRAYFPKIIQSLLRYAGESFRPALRPIAIRASGPGKLHEEAHHGQHRENGVGDFHFGVTSPEI
jgi:hypothetical protein